MRRGIRRKPIAVVVADAQPARNDPATAPIPPSHIPRRHVIRRASPAVDMSTTPSPKKAAPKAKAPAKAKKKAVKADASASGEPEATETGLILIDEPAPAPAAAEPVAAAAEPAPEPTREEVGRRAYELWLARGGSAFENWLEAERQLRRR